MLNSRICTLNVVFCLIVHKQSTRIMLDFITKFNPNFKWSTMIYHKE